MSVFARTVVVAFLLSLAAILSSCETGSPPAITVYKTPTCGCCNKWVEHLQSTGFEVATVELRDVTPIKTDNHVPAQLSSCHTALIDGYVIEGHVPAEDILRLLEERPQVAGLAVPGMPTGSPGMEGPNPEAYVVYTFDANASPRIFARHIP